MAITRLSVDGYGARRAGSFAGRAAVAVVTAIKKRQDSSGRRISAKKKRDFLIQDELYEQRIKTSIEVPDSIHKPVKQKPARKIPLTTINDIRPAISQIVTDEDVELVLMVLDAIEEAA